MATTEAASVKTLYARATGLLREGKDDEALALYARIVDENANIPEVHFQIARIFLRNHHLARALTHIRAAARLKPEEADIWKVYADLVRAISQPDVQAEFRAALKKAPLGKRDKGDLSSAVEFTGKSRASLGGTPPDAFERMVSALTAGRVDEAEALARAEIARNPRSAAVHTLVAAACLTRGDTEAAEQAVGEALRLDQGYAEAHATQARILKAQGRAADCLHACNHALRLAPGMQGALRLRGECYAELGFSEEARRDFEALVSLDPSSAENRRLLARLLYDEKLYSEAAETARKALKRGLTSFGLHHVLAQALSEMGRPEEALAELEAGRRLAPDSALAAVRIGELKQTLGRFDESEAEFREAMRLAPVWGEVYRVYLAAKKLVPGDPLIDTMQSHFDDPGIAPKSRAQFGFALAKVMEDQKRHHEVFRYLDPANALMRAEHPYDISRRVAHVDRLIASCRTIDWPNVEPKSTNRFRPIFVSGMPRSGTTLVEQIIASHSRVTGAGEVSVAPGRTLALLGREGGAYRDAKDVTPQMFQALGDGFEAYMHTLYPDAERITDKSIQSFAYIGLMKLAMPEARFVVVRRDPRDNLLSIYKNVFPEGTHLYAYSVEDLAEYYRQFLRLVDFWREVVPDWFYEVHYEDLVANPAEEAPKLIQACGLDWEDACLDFHKTERRVKTLSVYQVRQPMYKTSTRAWERYGDDIRPLLDALGPEYADAAE
jgi:tetratricopeptide (TPR) repeat protein